MSSMHSLIRLLPLALVLACAPPAGPETPAPAEEDQAVGEIDDDRILDVRLQSPFAVEAVGEIPRWPAPVFAEGVGTGEEWIAITPGSSQVVDPAIRRAEAEAEEMEARLATLEPDPDAVPEGVEEMPVHRVARGESFWEIARRYDVPLQDLVNANLDIDPASVSPGDRLRIPIAARGADAPDPEELPREVAPPDVAPQVDEEQLRGAEDEVVHVVRAGDTLWSIARRYGVRVEAIQDVNDLRTEILRVGQELVIPE